MKGSFNQKISKINSTIYEVLITEMAILVIVELIFMPSAISTDSLINGLLLGIGIAYFSLLIYHIIHSKRKSKDLVYGNVGNLKAYKSKSTRLVYVYRFMYMPFGGKYMWVLASPLQAKKFTVEHNGKYQCPVCDGLILRTSTESNKVQCCGCGTNIEMNKPNSPIN